MSRELMCAYGNCANTMETGKGHKITVTRSVGGTVVDRDVFCCLQHAAAFMLKRARMIEGKVEMLPGDEKLVE